MRTLIRITNDPEGEARKTLGSSYAHDDAVINATARIFRAKLGGQVVWAYRADGLPTSAFVTPDQAIALRLCLYRGCGEKATYQGVTRDACNRHADFGMAPIVR